MLGASGGLRLRTESGAWQKLPRRRGPPVNWDWLGLWCFAAMTAKRVPTDGRGELQARTSSRCRVIRGDSASKWDTMGRVWPWFRFWIPGESRGFGGNPRASWENNRNDGSVARIHIIKIMTNLLLIRIYGKPICFYVRRIMACYFERECRVGQYGGEHGGFFRMQGIGWLIIHLVIWNRAKVPASR